MAASAVMGIEALKKERCEMGAMILIFAFVMSLIINVMEKVISSNNQANKAGEAETSLATEPSE